MFAFCQKTMCFFSYELKDAYVKNNMWPTEYKDIDDSERLNFISAPEGKTLGMDNYGSPVFIDAVKSTEQKETEARAARDNELTSSLWVSQRYEQQVKINHSPEISENQYIELLAYHQELRDWPAQPGWPDIDMPPAPDWLAEMKK